MQFIDLNLAKPLQTALKTCRFQHPTQIQQRAIPLILQGKDVIACAQTGSGKTAAFILPALEKLLVQGSPKFKKEKLPPKILILTPTRELARQITDCAKKLGQFLKFNVANLVGGMPYGLQFKELQRQPEFIIATPGRLIDHLQAKRLTLNAIEMFILDEADRMLEMGGFLDEINLLLKFIPEKRQTLLFSATIDKNISSLSKNLLNAPVAIDLSNEKTETPNIKQEVYKVNNVKQKMHLLRHFLNDAQIYKAIIFSATKINADHLANTLRQEGFSAAALHGDLSQNMRNRTLEKMRNGKIQYLIATDVAARGLDINDVSHVINYDLPRFCEDYVHRIGRTGRAGKSGTAISFALLPQDKIHISRIERLTKQRFKILEKHVSTPPIGETFKIVAEKEYFKKSPMENKKIKKGNGTSFKLKNANASSKKWFKKKPKSNYKFKKVAAQA